MAEMLQGQHFVWAARLAIARIMGDDDAEELVAHEVGDCVHCWQRIARQLANLAITARVLRDGENAVIDQLLGGIKAMLDKYGAEEAP